MRKYIIYILLFICTITYGSSKMSAKPVQKGVELIGRNFDMSLLKGVTISADSYETDLLYDYLLSSPLKLSKSSSNNGVFTLRRVDKVNGCDSPEGYSLRVTKRGIDIEAIYGAGLFYGVQTLLQMSYGNKKIPCVEITDLPRFEYRGLMLDVSRHFFGKDFLKKQIDAMAYYKLNRLHLHLTDAAGWRLEIKRYPLLTSFAAWRDRPLWKDWWNNGRLYKNEGDTGAYGGYYTQEDIKELVAYAQKHFITIIPEIEMPAHSEEVLTAYPELSCTHVPYKQSDFCVGNEKTFEFLENVLTEVMALFPSEYIHVGGDEAGKLSWGDCELCRKRMSDEKLKDNNELQSYLIHRVERFLNSKGRKLLGWDEILDGGLAPNATVMSWRGVEGGLKAIEAVHKAIMTPGSHCYFDSYQGEPDTQPEAIGGFLTIEKVYSFEPIPENISEEKTDLIYGVQANLWSEYIPTEKDVERMVYPRLLALAEVAWSDPSHKDFIDFRKRAIKAADFLKPKGYFPFDLKTELGNRVEAKKRIKHLGLGKKVIYLPKGKYYNGYTAGGDSALVDGIRGGWSYTDHRWQGFIDTNGLDVVIDLGKEKKIKYIGAEFMQICGTELFLPANVHISVSNDGKEYRVIKDIANEVVKDDKVTFKNFSWRGKMKARFVRYQAERGKFGGFIFTDEILIK